MGPLMLQRSIYNVFSSHAIDSASGVQQEDPLRQVLVAFAIRDLVAEVVQLQH